jgi:predicted transcriptional regulator
MTEDPVTTSVLGLTAQIVSAHVANNSVAADALPSLIQEVYKTLAGVGKEPTTQDKLQPAVPVKKSVFQDHIVCLEDGKKLKMLKRHLRSTYGMTPGEYRAKWGLPADYPMVAPAYAEKRNAFAKAIGLGRSRPEPEPEAAPAKRSGRRAAA